MEWKKNELKAKALSLVNNEKFQDTENIGIIGIQIISMQSSC